MSLFKKAIKKVSGSKEIKASTAYVFCSVLQKCLSFITLPLFTRLMTTEEFGLGTVYSSTMAIVIIFITLNLPYGSFSPAMMKFEKDREGYISAVNAICIFFTIIYFIIYFPLRVIWNDLLDLPTSVMILMGFEILFSTATQFWMGKARFEYKYKEVVIITLVSSVIATLVSLAAVILLPNKGEAKVLSHGIVISVIGLVILVKSLFSGRKCLNNEYWKYALSFNIPLIPYYLSQIVFNQSDRLMINKMCGSSDAAMYGVAYTLAFVLTFVLNAINNSFVPWMYRKIKDNQLKDNQSVSLIISLIMAFLILGIIALAPEIILIMGGEKYMPAVWVVPPVAISLLLLFYSQLFINIEFYFEEKYQLVIASIGAAVINIVLNYFFIGKFGFIAAGYTTLVSYIIFALSNYFAMNYICKKRNMDSKLYNYKLLLLILFGLMIMTALFMFLYNYQIIRYGIILFGIMMAFVFRRELIKIGKRVFKEIKAK